MARITKKTLEETYVHPRGWGDEVWIENRPEYCGKILRLKKGKRGSLHFHVRKSETMFLQSGSVTLLLVDPETGREYTQELFPGDSIFIPYSQVHQIIANEDSHLFEFSTMHDEDDSYRVRKGD